MAERVAPPRQVKTEDISTDTPQAPKDRTDPSTASALLPARVKRKFAALASVAHTFKMPVTTGIAKQGCVPVPVDKGNSAVEQSGASAQYFSVLYTKRAANKVSHTVLFGMSCDIVLIARS